MRLDKSPLGLLELFRLRTLGRAPDEFTNAVSPTVDVTDFYGADLLASVAENSAPGAIGAGIFAAVAAFPRRYIALSGNIVIGAAAGTFVNLRLAIQNPGALVVTAIETTLNITPAAGQTYSIAAKISRGLVLPAGWTVGLIVGGDAAGADHVAQIRYTFSVLDGR